MLWYALVLIALSATLILAAISTVSKLTKRCYSDQKRAIPLPGPKGYPILGSSVYLSKFDNNWKGFSELRKTFGDVFGIAIGTTNCVVVSSYEAIKEVLVTKANDFDSRPDFLRFHAIFRGDRNKSIALCNWTGKQTTRRAIAFPFMHPKGSTIGEEKMGIAIESELDYLVADLNSKVNQPIFPRFQLLSFTANVFYQYLCSTRFELQDKKFKDVVQNYDLILKELFSGYALDFMPWLKPFHGSKLNELSRLSSSVADLIDAEFDAHMLVLDEENPRDLIDLLLIHLNSETKTKTSLTINEAEIIIDDLIGGHSALGNMLLWALYLLGQEPIVQDVIRDEVGMATSNNRRKLQIQDRCQLQYVEATVYEILRVVSSPIIPHVSTNETTIKGFSVAANTLVLFNTYDQNMDAKYWDEPKKFKPERFLTENGCVRKPEFFLPFGTGKRSCLGDRIVRSTMCLTIATLVSNYTICLPEGQPTPAIDEIPGIFIPKHDISVIFKPIVNN